MENTGKQCRDYRPAGQKVSAESFSVCHGKQS